MKLKNKKTGEIVENAYIREAYDSHNKRTTIAVFVRDGNRPPERVSTGYETLTALNAEWEDYEEPKEFWCIDEEGIIRNTNEENWPEESVVAAKSIGNYFESEEEVKRAVEKLKAWKRLKDKGFRFDSFDVANREVDNVICGQAYFKAGNYDREEMKPDLDICFGGEE